MQEYSSLSNQDRENRRLMIMIITGGLLLALIVFGCLFAGFRATKVDRAYRTAKVQECSKLVDETAKALCITVNK